MNNIDPIKIIKEHTERKKKAVEIKIKEHKCYRCVWSRWNEEKYICILPRCLKGLGNYNK